eukprot:GDKI01044439.1.p1 GENE.GDKI01044439.1~~GDKI01044439.1.p1  ORF type:complete len:128 (-),score=23.61 GDKI01044439.1:37-420(-)
MNQKITVNFGDTPFKYDPNADLPEGAPRFRPASEMEKTLQPPALQEWLMTLEALSPQEYLSIQDSWHESVQYYQCGQMDYLKNMHQSCIPTDLKKFQTTSTSSRPVGGGVGGGGPGLFDMNTGRGYS